METAITIDQPTEQPRRVQAGRTTRLARVAGTFLAAVALLAAVAAPVSAAKSWRGVNITRTDACHYTVTYSWESMGHGSGLTAWVYLVGVEDNGSSVIATHSFSPKTGKTGYVSYDFVSTQSFPYRYQGYAYLQTSRGTIIAKSEVSSASLVPGFAESCAA